jgi:hypothetical protein
MCISPAEIVYVFLICWKILPSPTQNCRARRGRSPSAPQSDGLKTVDMYRAAEERTLHIEFVELPQQPQVFVAFLPRLIVIGGTGQPRQTALLPDAQNGMIGIDPSALVLS